MSGSITIPILERPSFFDGQRLMSGDLDTVQRFHRELRWLHNRGLHGWGIAFGYAVTGARGVRSVQVAPGYALDCLGRDLILSEPVTLPVPAVSGTSSREPARYYLTVSYADDADLMPQMRAGVCDTDGAVRRPERPIVRWQDPNDTDATSRYRRGIDIILATVQVRNCQLADDVSTAGRRNAVPAQQPYVAAGQTTSGSTSWQPWPNEEAPVGVVTTVSTASAGFRITPRYQAHVVGQRFFLDSIRDGQFRMGIIDGYSQIAAVTASSFELRMILPGGVTTSGGNPVQLNPDNVLQQSFMGRLQAELDWHVVWMGVEG